MLDPSRQPDQQLGAEAQEDVFYDIGLLSGNGFRLMAGDFNLGPSSASGCAPNTTPNPHLNEWRYAYEEPDEGYPFISTTDGGNCKIDYIWAYDLNVTAYNVDITEFDPNVDDHRHYAASFSFSI